MIVCGTCRGAGPISGKSSSGRTAKGRYLARQCKVGVSQKYLPNEGTSLLCASYLPYPILAFKVLYLTDFHPFPPPCVAKAEPHYEKEDILRHCDFPLPYLLLTRSVLGRSRSADACNTIPRRSCCSDFAAPSAYQEKKFRALIAGPNKSNHDCSLKILFFSFIAGIACLFVNINACALETRPLIWMRNPLRGRFELGRKVEGKEALPVCTCLNDTFRCPNDRCKNDHSRAVTDVVPDREATKRSAVVGLVGL